jgi:hypothetical protein
LEPRQKVTKVAYQATASANTFLISVKIGVEEGGRGREEGGAGTETILILAFVGLNHNKYPSVLK